MRPIPANLIRTKRDGGTLSADEIEYWIDAYCREQISDAQMAALAMAICLQGCSDHETAALTRAMTSSGVRLARVSDKPRVDKHSTGGLGDKVSLILAPLLACCDLEVPMISGRGLGRTGGTLDKLEAIPGFRTQLSLEEANAVLRDCGAFIISATPEIAPADRKLYALRDVTGTVESTGLITASILSKKLAAQLDALVMDVKVGWGGFMTDLAQARTLAERLSQVGQQAGLPTSVVLSDMTQPLGRAVGNAIEVNEAVDVLQGSGPMEVRELTLSLAATVWSQVDPATPFERLRQQLAQHLDSGRAWSCFERMVALQGGRLSWPLDVAKPQPVIAHRSGYVQRIDCPAIGDAVIEMGGGRRQTGDSIDPRVGVDMQVKIGDRVERGQPLCNLHFHGDWQDRLSSDPTDWIALSDDAVEPTPLIQS